MTKLHFRNDILSGLHEAAVDMHAVGAMTDADLAKITRLAIKPIETISPEEIKAVRLANNVSQPVFAAVLNVSPNAVKSWEQGIRTPNGAALRMIDLIRSKGIDALAY